MLYIYDMHVYGQAGLFSAVRDKSGLFETIFSGKFRKNWNIGGRREYSGNYATGATPKLSRILPSAITHAYRTWKSYKSGATLGT